MWYIQAIKRILFGSIKDPLLDKEIDSIIAANIDRMHAILANDIISPHERFPIGIIAPILVNLDKRCQAHRRKHGSDAITIDNMGDFLVPTLIVETMFFTDYPILLSNFLLTKDKGIYPHFIYGVKDLNRLQHAHLEALGWQIIISAQELADVILTYCAKPEELLAFCADVSNAMGFLSAEEASDNLLSRAIELLLLSKEIVLDQAVLNQLKQPLAQTTLTRNKEKQISAISILFSQMRGTKFIDDNKELVASESPENVLDAFKKHCTSMERGDIFKYVLTLLNKEFSSAAERDILISDALNNLKNRDMQDVLATAANGKQRTLETIYSLFFQHVMLPFPGVMIDINKIDTKAFLDYILANTRDTDSARLASNATNNFKAYFRNITERNLAINGLLKYLLGHALVYAFERLPKLKSKGLESTKLVTMPPEDILAYLNSIKNGEPGAEDLLQYINAIVIFMEKHCFPDEKVQLIHNAMVTFVTKKNVLETLCDLFLQNVMKPHPEVILRINTMGANLFLSYITTAYQSDESKRIVSDTISNFKLFFPNDKDSDLAVKYLLKHIVGRALVYVFEKLHMLESDKFEAKKLETMLPEFVLDYMRDGALENDFLLQCINAVEKFMDNNCSIEEKMQLINDAMITFNNFLRIKAGTNPSSFYYNQPKKTSAPINPAAIEDATYNGHALLATIRPSSHTMGKSEQESPRLKTI